MCIDEGDIIQILYVVFSPLKVHSSLHAYCWGTNNFWGTKIRILGVFIELYHLIFDAVPRDGTSQCHFFKRMIIKLPRMPLWPTHSAFKAWFRFSYLFKKLSPILWRLESFIFYASWLNLGLFAKMPPTSLRGCHCFRFTLDIIIPRQATLRCSL